MMNASIIQPADEAKVNLEAKFTHQFTEQNPARLQIRFTNKGESSRQFRFGSSPPLSEYAGERIDGGGELVLVPDNMRNVSIKDQNDDGELRIIPEKPTDSCWQIEDQIIGQDVLVPRTLNPGESVTETYTVLAGADNTSCIISGDFQFPAGFEAEAEQFSWKLVISVHAEN